jgi:heme/copper-type cytochrome/quinol oxidase subunit 2
MMSKISIVLTETFIKAPVFENVNDLFVTIAKNYQCNFQEPNSKLMEGIIRFHDDLMVFLTFILFFVIYILYYVFATFSESASTSRGKIKTPEFGGFVHHPMLEII